MRTKVKDDKEAPIQFMDEEFLQFIRETEYYDLWDLSEENIVRMKNTLFYQKWQCENAWKSLIDVIYKGFKQ